MLSGRRCQGRVWIQYLIPTDYDKHHRAPPTMNPRQNWKKVKEMVSERRVVAYQFAAYSLLYVWIEKQDGSKGHNKYTHKNVSLMSVWVMNQWPEGSGFRSGWALVRVVDQYYKMWPFTSTFFSYSITTNDTTTYGELVKKYHMAILV